MLSETRTETIELFSNCAKQVCVDSFRFKFSLKISYSTHACLAQLDQNQTCKLVIVNVVSSSPAGGNFFFKTPRC